MKNRMLSMLVLALAFMLFFGDVSALSISNSAIDPQGPIWLDNTNSVQVDFTVDCQNNTEVPRVYLTFPDTTKTSIVLSDSNAPYLGRYTVSQEGLYQANFTCSENSTVISDILNFEVKKMTLDISSPSIDTIPTVYPTGYMEDGDAIRVDFNINGVPVKVEDEPEYALTLIDSSNNRYSIKLLEDNYDTNLKDWRLTAHLNNKDIPAGLYSLEVLATYIDSKNIVHTITDVKSNSVRVNQALRVILQSPTPGTKIPLSGSSEYDLKVEVLEKDTALQNLGAPSFDVYLEGEGVKTSLTISAITTPSDDVGYYTLKVNIPEMDKKNVVYDLYVEIPSYSNYNSAVTEKVQIEYVLSLIGTLSDPTGNVYTSKNSMVKFIDDDTNGETNFDINGIGEYKQSLKAGAYTVKLQFPQIWEVKISGVELKSSTKDTIKYDYFVGNPGIAGINVAKLIVTEFGLPFDNAQLQIPYNDALVKNEKMIEVYSCTTWNFGARECASNWVKVPANVDIVANYVGFNVTHLSAFVIGEKMGIFFEGELDSRDVYSGESVTLSSVVKDSKGNGVSGVDMSYSIEGTSLTGKTTSGANGEFTLVINTPSTAGKFNVDVVADKSPFSKYEKTYMVSTEDKKSISFLVPETTDIILDKEKKVQLTVFNTGQVDLTNVQFDVVGLQSSWYSVIPKLIETIKVGEKKTIDVLINIPEYDCIDEGCKKYYFVDVQLKSDQLHEEASFTAKIQSNVTTIIAQSDVDAKSDSSLFTIPDMTGLFTMNPGSANVTNIYIILFFVLFAFVLITIKKKQRKTMGSSMGNSRRGISSAIGSIKRGIGSGR